MEKDLINTIGNYLVKRISDNIQDVLSIHWGYNAGMNHFVLKFELANTQFLIITNGRSTMKNGMIITPDEHLIKIECHNYLLNFEQVANIVGQLEKELKHFEKTFPSIARRQYVRENYSTVNQKASSKTKHKGRLYLNLSKKYLDDNRPEDKSGAKQIALYHLFGKEIFNMKMKK